jgi:penicillin amidase/acyl-homoserine-lactone acylase
MPLFYGFDNYIDELINLMSSSEKVSSINSLSNNPTVAAIKSHFKPSGSNAFAVSKKRSKNDETLLVINSHQPLTGPVAWYEAQLKSEEGWNMMGGLFPGSPFIFVGFNDNLGWGLTVNKPDLSDAFLLKINPLNPDQYLLDNEWVNFKSKTIELPTKLLGPLHWTFKKEAKYSEHGPVLETKNGTYAIFT